MTSQISHIDAGTAHEIVQLRTSGSVAEIVLNSPGSLNAISPRLLEKLAEALQLASADREINVIVICGAGRSFCAGFDLKSDHKPLGPLELQERAERFHNITRLIRSASVPVIASVQGYALGAGCELALCADLIIAANDAEFGFPEVEVGLSITGGISYVLPMAVGLAKAKELIILGERFGATAAKQLGLINFVVDESELDSATQQLAERIAAKPLLAVRAAKASLNVGAPGAIEGAYVIETSAATLVGNGKSQWVSDHAQSPPH